MTTSAWTKSEIAQRFGNCGTLRQMIAELEADFSSRGEVICEISVNGLVLNEQDEVRYAESTREEIYELSVQTNKPGDLITQALKSAIEMIPQIEAAALATSELMRAGEKASASKKFDETIGGCQWFVEALVQIRGAAAGIGAPIQNASQWAESERQITNVIVEVSGAYSKSDVVLVSDLLEYELTSALHSWKSTVDAVLQSRAA